MARCTRCDEPTDNIPTPEENEPDGWVLCDDCWEQYENDSREKN